jgi:sialic acid synthase SpsE
MNTVTIGNRVIGDGHPCFIIAEIGSNHNQSLAQAKEMIKIAAQCGADAVKFQSLDYDEMHAFDDPAIRALYNHIKLDESWYPELKRCADKHGVLFFSCPCYLRALDALEKTGVQLYKIASPQTRAFPQVIRATAKTGKAVIISTGYCDDERIARAVRMCEEAGNRNFALLQCASQYPTSPENANLRMMHALKQRHNCPVGYSDNGEGIAVPIAAAALGANIIEKHFTLDKKSPGPDHAFASEPAEFAAMVQGIRAAELALGTGVKRVLAVENAAVQQYNLIYRVVAGRDFAAGEPLDGPHVLFKRAPDGIPAEDEPRWKGKPLARPVAKGAVLQWVDLGGSA